MRPPKTAIPSMGNDRKKRLADALRQNLRLRKARTKGANVINPSVEADEKQKDGKAD